MKKNKKENRHTFEEAFNELKLTVDKIESTHVNLEDMIVLIEKGMYLSDICKNKIDQVYNKIEIIKDRYNKNK